MTSQRTSRQATPVVEVTDLAKQFRREDGTIVTAIDDVSFAVAERELVVLLGPSGCGKTTLLRTIAGLETPDSGELAIGGRVYFCARRGIDTPPERRNISMVFQSYALWPHMTVFKNVAYPLLSRRGRKPSKADVAERVRMALKLVGIGDLERQFPGQMSGGQQQRVALARALVSNDQLVLFDEPLSNVDAKVREQLRAELVAMQREIGFSGLFVTHDQVEAMQLAHRIAVLDRGRIAQFGTPEDIYHRPANRYVARFIGAINETIGTVTEISGRGIHLNISGAEVVAARNPHGLTVGDRASVMWRPECGVLSPQDNGAVNRWRGTVRAVAFVGSHTEYEVVLAGYDATVWSPRVGMAAPGEDTCISVDPEDVLVMPVDQATDESDRAPHVDVNAARALAVAS